MITKNRPQRIHKPRGKSLTCKPSTCGRSQRHNTLPESMGTGFEGEQVSWRVVDNTTREIPVTISSKNPDR